MKYQFQNFKFKIQIQNSKFKIQNSKKVRTYTFKLNNN